MKNKILLSLLLVGVPLAKGDGFAGYSANSDPQDADIVLMEDDPAGTPNTETITLATLKTYFQTSIDGENIQDDTIDDDSIDFGDVTLDDLTFDVGSVSKTEYGYLNGVTSAIQTQLNTKLASGSMDSFAEWVTQVGVTGTPTGSLFLRDDGSFQSIPGGGDALTSNPLSQFAATTSAQLRGVLSDESGTGVFLTANGVGTSLTALNGENIQNDTIDDDSIDFTDVTLDDFTFDVGSVDKTEFGYLNGVTSAIQTQLNAKLASDGTFTGLVSDAQYRTTTTTQAGTEIDVTKMYNKITITDDDTLTLSASMTTGDWAAVEIVNSDVSDTNTVTLPAGTWVSDATGGTITDFKLPASTSKYFQFRYDGTNYRIFGEPFRITDLASATPASGDKFMFVDATDGLTKQGDFDDLGGGSGAPTGVDYWVGTADAGLSAEIVVNDLASLDTAIGLTGSASSSTWLRGDGSWDGEVLSSNSASGGAGYVATSNGSDRRVVWVATTGSGSFVKGTSPTIASPAFSGTSTGTYTLGGTPTLGASAVATTQTSTDNDTSVSTTAFANRVRTIFTESLGTTHTVSISLATGEGYGSVHYVTAATTITLPAVSAGTSFTFISTGANTVTIELNGSDKFYLDGTALDDGDTIDSPGAAGDVVVITYYDGTGWWATSNSWTDGGAT